MIRLASNHAAITAPLVASNTAFPGIPIGRSLLDGRPFRLSPVLVDATILPSTNSIALGGLGSGKSTSAKVRARRESLYHEHQFVVIDSYGEQQNERTVGEWAALTHDLGGQVIQAGEFTLNPCSPEFPHEVREQLIRSLIAAVEPAALTPQTAHALQHALNSPKADSLNGVVDALQDPEDGRYPAEKLRDWGVDAVLALTRYTDGSLRGLFDGPTAGLPPCDLPMISFDFTKLDRNSPAIPALMAAIACWVEHVWLRQSTAVHRHLVLEEAWQILLSPVTAELIQRLLKNSRKAGLSLDVVMHTISDLGEGRAQDLAKLCEIVYIGRLSPEEAARVGAIFDLPTWVIEMIPTLEPGHAIWKIGPDYIDVVQTTLDEEEVRLTDTATRRRKAQQAMAADGEPAVVLAKELLPEEPEVEDAEALDEIEELEEAYAYEAYDYAGGAADDGLGFDLPPNVVDTLYPEPQLDQRHHAVLQAAGAGRYNEAAELAALGERADITAHGINSPQATAWLITRAEVADRAGNTVQAAQLRATVARMGNNEGARYDRYERTTDGAYPPAPPVPDVPAPEPVGGDDRPVARARRRWAYVGVIAAVALAAGIAWQKGEDDTKAEERQQKVEDYKGRSGANLVVDSVDADVVARWTREGDAVIVELRTSFEPDARYLRIDAAGRSAESTKRDNWYPESPEIRLPVDDPYADVTVRVAIGGKSWKEGSRAESRTIRLSPTGVAYDDKGEKLPSAL